MTSWAPIDHYEDPGRNAIGWCLRTHNFFRGCSAVSEACVNCYAVDEGVHQVRLRPHSPYARLVLKRGTKARWTGIVEPTGVGIWMAPFQTRQRWLAFTNSMSDVFHEALTDEQVLFFLRVLHWARWHTWQVLTKRHERLASILSRLVLRDGDLHLAPAAVPWEQRHKLPNVWFGVTAENQRRANERIPHLLQVKAAVRFISAEPLLGPVDLSAYLPGLHWVIVGGESAEGFRPMEEAWVRTLRDECVSAKVPFFFKQRAGKNPRFLSKELDGESWRQLPARPLLPLVADGERRGLARWVRATYSEVMG